jgi:probable F420-dependent oxidoreductase
VSAELRRALGPVGVWSMQLRTTSDRALRADAAAELDELGYGSIFVPGRDGGDVLDVAAELLAATRRSVVATGILNVWAHEPAEVAAVTATLGRAHPGRFLLGLGVSHPVLVDREDPGRYRRPLAKMRSYLDELGATDEPPAPAGTVLAALGPKMLALAAERTAGAHPYLVPVAHTRAARQILGPGPLLAPELPVVLDADPRRARDRARTYVSRYLETFPNYVDNLLRHGFGEDDVRDGGSDRLIDGLVASGDEAAVAARVAEHHAAGADHVCVQVVPEGDDPPREEWRRLAPALLHP